MGVPVHFKPRQRWLRALRKPSVLGGGLLERARSTTLALLGVTTAVGLAMVAIALNQSWPVIADSPIPGFSSRQEAIGEATVAARAGAGLPVPGPASATESARQGSAGAGAGARAPQAGLAPPASAELVVAPSAPVGPRGDEPSGGGDPTSAPSPTGTPPQPPAGPVAVSEPPQPKHAPPAPPAVETTPPPVSAEVPVDSSEGDGWDEDDDWDDDEDDDWGGDRWHDHDHGHHWGSRRHDD